jgi:hypothetical protein
MEQRICMRFTASPPPWQDSLYTKSCRGGLWTLLIEHDMCTESCRAERRRRQTALLARKMLHIKLSSVRHLFWRQWARGGAIHSTPLPAVCVRRQAGTTRSILKKTPL